MAVATAYPSSPPYALILLVVVAMILVVPAWLAEQSSLLEIAMEMSPVEISPVMVMAAPVVLILIIRWLSSPNANCVAAFFGGGDPSSIHRAGGSPVGVAVVLLIVLLMIWYQSSGDDEESEE